MSHGKNPSKVLTGVQATNSRRNRKRTKKSQSGGARVSGLSRGDQSVAPTGRGKSAERHAVGARKSGGSRKRTAESKDRRAGDAERLFKKVPELRTTAEKRQFVGDQWEELGSVKKACEVMGISPSTYYYRPKVDEAVREKQDADLKEKIEAIQVENP